MKRSSFINETAASPTIAIYDSENIDQLSWGEGEENSYAKKFLLPLIKNGTNHYIENIQAEIKALCIDSHILPMTIIDGRKENSFVCSPYAHYISYALDFTKVLEKKALKNILEGFILKFGKLLDYGKVNRIIFVNSWLVPTDLYPQNLKKEQIEAITFFLKKRYPDYAIAFRSINNQLNKTLKQDLRKQRYDLIATRQVFFTDTKNEQVFQTRIFKSDLKLLKESKYEIVDGKSISAQDLPQILELYKKLYIEKHSKLNPQINSNYMELLFKQELLQLKVLKKEGSIEGVFGYFIRGGVMTAPFFGYSGTEKNVYRLLSTLLLLEAKEKGLLLHQSAGASFYKKVRRAESAMEFMAVYKKHLPFKQRLVWNILKWIMNIFATPFMKRY